MVFSWLTQKTGQRSPLKFIIGISLGLSIITPSAVQAQFTAADYRQQGLAYRQQGQLSEAIASFQQAVDLEPYNIDGRVLLGWTQHLAGEGTQAAKTLTETFYLSPSAVPTSNALGIVYLVNGDLKDAALVHTWAAVLDNQNEIAYYNLSLTYQRLQRYDWAIATAQRAAVLEPTNPHPFVALAIAYWSQGQTQQAQQAYQQALNLDGRYGDRPFLDYLAEAAFSPEQIELSGAVLDSMQ
jgi:Flp pilus assembly protein TadD